MKFHALPALSQESERSWYLCVRGIDFSSFYDFEFDFGIFRKCGIFLFFIFCLFVLLFVLHRGLNIRENLLRIESEEGSLYFDQNKTLQSSASVQKKKH
jgi:hypothetical protein